MRAMYQGAVIAEADKKDLIYIEGNWYFPPKSVKSGSLEKSPTPYVCPWKGTCQYFNVAIDGNAVPDGAWSYPEPKQSAIETVKKDFSNYIAFSRDITVSE